MNKLKFKENETEGLIKLGHYRFFHITVDSTCKRTDYNIGEEQKKCKQNKTKSSSMAVHCIYVHTVSFLFMGSKLAFKMQTFTTEL